MSCISVFRRSQKDPNNLSGDMILPYVKNIKKQSIIGSFGLPPVAIFLILITIQSLNLHPCYHLSSMGHYSIKKPLKSM